MKKKKRIKIIIIAVLVVAVVAGSITGVVYYKNSKGLASVMSVSMISTTNDSTSMTSEGMVCDDACQTINLKDGQKVTEVYVTKDQQVKAGDKLLAYDVTSLSLSVEMKQLEIQSLENQLVSEKQKLDKLKHTKPVAKQPETPVTPEPQPDTQPAAPEQKPDEQHDVISDLSEAKGSGTEDDPYVFTCTEASYVAGSLLNTLADKSAVARFVIGDANAPDMELIVRGDKLGSYDDSDEIKLFLAGSITAVNEPSDAVADNATEQAAQTEADTAVEEKTYTADELKDAIKEQTRSVADVDLQKRIAQADLKELQSELEDGVVYAKKDGIVTTVCDPANPPQDGTPFLQLSGASGLYISGTIGELDLDTVKVGQSVSAVNYMTGDTYEGTISEISNVPSDSVNYYGDSNPNSSFYEYTAYIENPQNLKKGDSLQLTIDTSSEGSDSGLYIDKSYVRTENGQSYIYKDDNGKLKKQSVKTGKSLWGSYVEIKSGLTNDDYIAFPYGVREGEKTKVSEDGMY